MSGDWFTRAFGQAASDIRAKLIDEAWFGRRLPEPRPHDLGWSRNDHPRPADHTPPSHEQDRGIDR